MAKAVGPDGRATGQGRGARASPGSRTHILACPPPHAGRWERWRAAIILVVLSAVSAALRLDGLGGRTLWEDEAYTLALAQGDFGGMVARFRFEANGLLYPVIAHPFASVDTPLWALRAPAAVAGVLLVPATYWAARELLTRRAALVAAAMAAVSPFISLYSQQARAYTLVALLATASFAALARAVRLNDRVWWTAYVVLLTCALYSNWLAVLLVIPAHIVMIAPRGRAHRPALGAAAAIVASCTPLIVLSALDRSTGDPLFWVERPGIADVGRAASALLGGVIAAVLILAVAGVAAVQRKDRWSRPRTATLAVAAWAVVPIPLLFLVSQIDPVFVQRYCIAALPGACILVGLILDRWSTPVVALLTIAVVGAALWQFTRETRRIEYPAIDAAVAALQRDREPGDGVVWFSPGGLVVAGYYDAAFAGRDGRLFVNEWGDPGRPADTLLFQTPGGYYDAPDGPPTWDALRSAWARTGRAFVVVSSVPDTLETLLRSDGLARARTVCRIRPRQWPGVLMITLADCAGTA